MIVDTITIMNICDRIYNKTEWISNPAERELVRAQMIEGVRTALCSMSKSILLTRSMLPVMAGICISG